MKLSGKRILVTGGSSGIGLAIAQSLLAEGAHLVISGRRQQALDSALATLSPAKGTVQALSADVATAEGRERTLSGTIDRLNGLDVLINNAGVVRAGRLDRVEESAIRSMIEIDLVAPILLSRAALPELRRNGGMIVNISSAIALVGIPFYATYAAVKAGLAHFGEALRRELNGEDVRVLTVYPGATDTPMMTSSRAGPELGFSAEPAQAVADAVVAGMRDELMSVIRGGEIRQQMIALNRDDPRALDERFLAMKEALEQAVESHASL